MNSPHLWASESQNHICSKKQKSLKEKIQTGEKEFEEIETEFLALYKKIPNIPTLDTPLDSQKKRM
jgi:seryl-tRNA synthetase